MQKKLHAVQMAAEKEKEMLQKEHADQVANPVLFYYLTLTSVLVTQVYSLNKLNELLKKMLLNEKSGESEQAQYEIDAAFWKSEFECPICFEVRVTTVILNMVTTVAML